MKRMTNGKRIVSFLLAAAMLLGMFPAIAPSVVPEAEAATTAEFISLPITIRDYANDGMLFDFNEIEEGDVGGALGASNIAVEPTFAIRNGGNWVVSNGTATATNVATSDLNGYNTYTTTSQDSNLQLTYTLTDAEKEQLKYTNRVTDMKYIVLTFQTANAGGRSFIPETVTLTDDAGNTYVATYQNVVGAGAAGSMDTGFTRALYAIPDTVTESGIITSVTIDTNHKNSQTVWNDGAGETYNYTWIKSEAEANPNGDDLSDSTYLLVDPNTQYAFVDSGTNVVGARVTVNTNDTVSTTSRLREWMINFTNHWFFFLTGDANAPFGFLAYNDGFCISSGNGNVVWNYEFDSAGNVYVSLSGYYIYINANGTPSYTTTKKPLRLYQYTSTTPAADAGWVGDYQQINFNLMEVEFFDEFHSELAELRANGTLAVDAEGDLTAYYNDANNLEVYGQILKTGNNKMYGLLRSSTRTLFDPQTTDGDTEEAVNTNSMDEKMGNTTFVRYGQSSDSATLKNGVTEELHHGVMRTDLVESTLNGKSIQYRPEVVAYLAEVLQATLAYEKTATVNVNNEDVTNVNLNYVLGTKVINNGEMDLATAIRKQLDANAVNGEWQLGSASTLASTLDEYTDIKTCYDAAYFLLHNIFNDNIGYGQTISKYEELRLNKVSETEGTVTYVFDSYFGTDYGTSDAGVIKNTDTTADEDKVFNPIASDGYGITGSPYIDWSGDPHKAKYDSYNYLMSLEGHAQFIYYYDDNLYFEFAGDDDVYLFINDQLVLDLGAVHSDTEGRIYLNSVASLCGLEDGEAYDFDFYYMERHGHAAHFSIETNIKIVDPAMLTEKTGYQNGTEVGYNGYVNPAEPVNYSFELTNKGESQLTNLIFEDADIGVTVGYNEIIGVSESTTATTGNMTTYADLLVAVYNADGTVKQYVPKGSVTAETLKNLLTAGLKVNERIIIHGFKYKVTTWTDDTYFHNTVQTTATAPGENTTTAVDKILNGVASYRVQKPTYAFGTTHYYAWGKLNTDLNDGTLLAASGDITNSVTATNAELLALVNSATNASTGASAGLNITSLSNIQICSASGLTTVNYNTKATVNSDGTITYTATETGVDTYYFKATDNDGYTYGPIRVTVFTYGVADNVYVLDYSLPVELNGVNFGLTTNDIVYLADNPFVDKTDVTISMSGETSNYGAFELTNGTSSVESVLNGQSLKYTMTEFMSGIDSATITIVIKEGTTTDNRTNGITMIQKLEVAPASVVYYEDDFVDITYVNSTTDDGTGNVWAEYTTGDTVGTEQSADQDSNYGSDPNYSAEKQGTLTLDQDELRSSILEGLTWAKGLVYDKLTEEQKAIVDAIFAKLLERYDATLGGTASNGTIHELILSPGTANSEIMYFDFKGTGFELISRATQDLYAVLTVRVQEGTPNDDGTFTVGDSNGDGVTTSKVVPVITESEGGDVYEVPIIKIDGLPYSNYKVTLSASNSSSANREIYIDGIRIYNPLGTDDELTDVYYSADEEDAEFFEIRPLILDSTIAYMSVSTTNVALGAGSTLVEDITDDGNSASSTFQVATVDSGSYLTLGPNNELYLDATSSGTDENAPQIIVFYVTETTLAEGAERSIQVGAHRKIDTAAGAESGAVYLIYGGTADDIANGTDNIVAIESGTEQYISIDTSKLVFNNGVAAVMIGTTGGENAGSNILALTNLKLSGYAFTTAVATQMNDLANGSDPASSDMVTTGYSLRRMLAAPVVEETTPEETVPEETVPEETVPEETVPEETVPEESVPEETVPEETVPAVNESLTVNSAKFAAKRVRAGSATVMTVTTSAGADSLLILDEDGNAVDYTIVSAASSSDSGINGWFAKLIGAIFGGSSDGVTYTISLTVEGSSGDEKIYTVYAVDTEGARSGNFQTAVVTIR